MCVHSVQAGGGDPKTKTTEKQNNPYTNWCVNVSWTCEVEQSSRGCSLSCTALQLQQPCHCQVHDRIAFDGVQGLICMHRMCMGEQCRLSAYMCSVLCAHAVSLIVSYAKGNMANWCHLVGLLGTRGLSMVPRHIGVVKINTVTLFGRKRHWTIYYCVYFSLSHLKGPSYIHTMGGRTHKNKFIMCMHQQQNLATTINNFFIHQGSLILTFCFILSSQLYQ